MRYYHVINSGHESLKSHNAVSGIQLLGPKIQKLMNLVFMVPLRSSNGQEIASANGMSANQRARRIEYFSKQF